jgi:L-2-hydroxyglutarate oxidase LhgO
LPINRCGKLVVARNEAELSGLDELMRRARVNGVTLESVSAEDARRIEPRVRTWERALFSPTTSSVDPRAVMAALCDDAAGSGVSLRTGVAYRGLRSGVVQTSLGEQPAGYVINAAGLHADRVARDFGFSTDYRILPFKGVYLYGGDNEELHTHVYPVPDLRYPFLGVHFTVRVDGRVKIGPSAIPAFWREQYGGFGTFHLGECLEILWREAELFIRNDFEFRRLAAMELRKYSRRHLVGLAAQLVAGVDVMRYRRWGEPGIRAQLVNVKARRLEMDFRFEGDERSFHVLNAVSPAFTCAMPFSRYVADRVGTLGRETGRTWG